MRKSLGVRNPVAVVVDRKDARVVLEAQLDQDVQTPRGLRDDRVAGCAKPDDRRARDPLEARFRACDIVPALIGGHRIDQPMAIPMRADLMTACGDLLDHPRSSLRFPAQDEERSLDAVLVQDLQETGGILLDAAFVGGPTLETNAGLERRHLIVVFDVDRQGVQHAYTAAHASRTWYQVYFSTSCLARRAMSTARSGCSRRPATALAIAAGSPGGTSNPVSPSRIIAPMSPAPVDTTGSPAARASSTDTGWLSTTDELTNTSA